MPLSTVQLARLSTLSLLSALLVIELSPGAPRVHAQSVYAANPAISLTASADLRGYRIAVSGSGFAANSTITLAVDGSSGAYCTADVTGSFSACAYAVPPETGGTHTLTASDGIANSASAIYTASAFAGYTNPVPPASFISSGQATNTGDDPALRLSSGAGKVGSNIAVSGSGFEPNQDIALAFDGRSVATSCTTKGDGSFRYCVLTIPAAVAGTHTVTASDNANSAAAGYTVNPALSLTPSTGAAGNGATVSGTGFDAYAPITVSFDGTTVSASCIANAVGSFRYCVYTVPAASAGSHTVTASDYSTNVASVRFYHSASAVYTITPAISLNQSAGAVGSAVTLSGSSYAPNSILTVTFDGAALTTSGICTTDAGGYLLASSNCGFTVPATTAGLHTVTVSDGTYSGSATFTVNGALSLIPSAGAGTVIRVISLIPSAGPVGSGAAVSGTGFAPYSTIAVTFDGSSIATSCTTDATGSFSYCVYTVPAAAAGIHTVTASDGTAYSASAIFTVTPTIFTVIPAIFAVTPAISLNRIAGAVGSTVLLSGSTYTPNSTLTITFNGAARRTSGICITDASGYLLASNNCTFTVPAVPAGYYTVTASDGTYSGSTTFTVTRAISLTPRAGLVDSMATVNGSGFMPRRTVALTFGGSSVTATALGGIPCTSDGSGRFSACTFQVPAATVGRHTVTAWDGMGSSTGTFTVNAAITSAAAPQAPTATNTPAASTPTATPQATATDTATATPPAPVMPTSTPTPTQTVRPTATATPRATATDTATTTPPAPVMPASAPIATRTARPTATATTPPSPTQAVTLNAATSPQPKSTPAPTAATSPQPKSTSAPTAPTSPKPKSTPAPTAARIP